MIAPQELRIGNYVEYANVICKVLSYSKEGLLQTDGVTAPIVAYQSIELTEAWLEKFGFEIEKSQSHCIAFNDIGYKHELQLDKEFDRKENCWNITKYGGGYRLIYYVHQLQNLYFDLTGYELIINKL